MATRGINKVILVGNLGQDPEVRYLQNGGAVANITLATSESWRDKQSGEQREKTEWHRVVLYGKLAEVAGEYLRKGSQVYIEGQLATRKWQDQSGQDRYTTQVEVKGYSGVMQMLGGRTANSQSQPQGAPQRQNGQQGQPPAQGQPTQPRPPAQQQGQPHYPPAAAGYTQGGYDEPPMDFDDDIPF